MAIWYFISGLFRNLYIGVMTVFGRIRIYRHFPWFAYDPSGYQVKSVQIRNKEEVQKRTRSVYCHELVRSCFPDLDIPTIQPVLWRGMIRSKKRQFLAQSFFESPDFLLLYDSDYSEARCDQK